MALCTRGAGTSPTPTATATTEDLMVMVACGGNNDDYPVVGWQIRAVRAQLATELTIPREAKARVDGVVVPEDHVIAPGTRTVEFIHPDETLG